MVLLQDDYFIILTPTRLHNQQTVLLEYILEYLLIYCSMKVLYWKLVGTKHINAVISLHKVRLCNTNNDNNGLGVV